MQLREVYKVPHKSLRHKFEFGQSTGQKSLVIDEKSGKNKIDLR